jgi:hypothetical protein
LKTGLTVELQSSTTGWTRFGRKAAAEDKAQRLGGFGEEQNMAMGKLKSLEMEILRVAALLGEGDEGLNQEELRRALDSAGIESALSTARFHEAVLRLAEDLRRGGQMVPLSGRRPSTATEPSAAPSRRARSKHWRPSR